MNKPLPKETLAQLEATLTALLNESGADCLRAARAKNPDSEQLHYGKMLGITAVAKELQFAMCERLLDRLREIDHQLEAIRADQAGAA